MGRRVKPSKGQADAKRPPASKPPKDEGTKFHDLEKRLAEALEKLQARNRELVEAQEQQTATSDILRVISQSPTDLQPVFETIAERAARLCDAAFVGVFRFDGEWISIAALSGLRPDEREAALRYFPRRPTPGGPGLSHVVLTGQVAHIPDVQSDPAWRASASGPAFSTVQGFRAFLAVPLIREGVCLGAVNVWRREASPFSEQHIELLKTFADQGVIAIENVRLFKELEVRNQALTESLEQQTATAEILRVISQSQTDIQPVFDTIVKSAARLCDGVTASLCQFDGELLHWVSQHNNTPAGFDAMRQRFPRALGPDTIVGRAIIERAVIHVRDCESDPDVPVESREIARAYGYRSVISVPMLREAQPIGAILVARAEAGYFSERQIALLKAFADQAVIAIENVRLFRELQASNAELRESLEQQTATSEILRVISSSPTDLQPVMDTVAESAARLCNAIDAQIFQIEGGVQVRVASYGSVPAILPRATPPNPRLVSGRAILEQRTIHVHDLAVEIDREYPDAKPLQQATGQRTTLATPLLREGVSIGVILIRRLEVRPFTETEINLLETFANQAVIAVENVRLFRELQASNRDLTTALDTQTATSDILRVISRSQTDVQPVFDAILASAVRLLRAYSGALTRIGGDQIVLVALTSTDDAGDAVTRTLFPQLLKSEVAHAQAIRDRAPVNLADALTDPRVPEAEHARARVRGYRSLVVVPMLRHDEAVGAIAVTRREPGGFTDDEIALLKTFADQAVIAIENVRLFTELHEKNRALTEAHAQVTEALEQQTATSEVLKVISRSAFDLQPVLESLVENAVRLCGADKGLIYRQEADLYRIAVSYGHSSEFLEVAKQYPIRQDRASATGRAALERRAVHIHDILADPEYTWAKDLRAEEEMHRTILAVPMLREGAVIGVIVIRRTQVLPFSDKQIELVTTFADQAVIAIENVRLFKELEARTQDLTRSVGELQALGEVGQAISSTLDLRTVLSTIVARATQLAGTDAGVIYEYDEQREVFVPRATAYLEAEIVETMLATPVRKGEGATGRLAETQEPIQVPDILAAPAESRVRGALVRAGYRALLAVPLVRDGHLIGGLTVIRKATGTFASEVIELLQTFATQSSLAIQNARLFREIEDKSRQLEVASQHKSEFLANMSHELRTPLNAIIGFSEVLTDRMFGELNEKQDEYLKDIYASGTHLLSLINDILDLSKIEAGRMELELGEFDLPTALDNALMLVRERAQRRSLTLHKEVDAGVGQIRGDERKIRQVVLNLLSNAIKFTPEGGRIEVAAVPKDGLVEVSVSDTGVGIAPEDQDAVFEEFRQVGTAEKKAEGTGLGLTLCRKFVELHGGRIWVKSQVDEGSTFTFTIPVYRGE